MDALDHSATHPSDFVVELSGVRKTYRQKQRSEKLTEAWRGLLRPQIKVIEALKEINLQVRRGEIVAYAGPNGAGKSTTIKLLSSLLAPDAGSVRVLGMNPVQDRTRYVQRIGVVFGQRTELWWDQPVAASFEWKRVVWNVPRPAYERTLGFVKEVLGLDEFFHTLARELSLGQKMRADLAMALLHDPEILFLDEPTLGLDVLAKRNILNFIKELNRTKQVTVMVTSHDMSDLEQLAGRIVMIHRGSIAFDADFSQLRSEYTDTRRLILETVSAEAPALTAGVLVSSSAGRHEYVFNASEVKVTTLIEQAVAQAEVIDIEMERAPVDDVIADIYESWQRP